MNSEIKRAGGAAPRRLLGLALWVAGCGTLIGVQDSKVQGVCETSAECAPDYDCLLGACRNGCTADGDCGPGARCLKAIGTSACIPVTEGCGQGCPEGTACVADVCRTSCTVAEDCAGAQECRLGACASVDEPPGNHGGSGGSGPAPIGGSADGGAGTANQCNPDEPACDGNRPTTCNADGTGYVGGGQRCSSKQACLAGACETLECTPSARFCSGNAVRQCADNGLSSAEAETCASDQYCDAPSATCKVGVCAPDQKACDGEKKTTCNATGSGYVGGGTLCGAGTTCEAGECVTWLCPKPGESYCQAQDVKSCSANGLSSEVAKTCSTSLTCVAAAGAADCKGECGPTQEQCSGNGLQTCDASGAYGAAVACGASKTCVLVGNDASCTGVCAPAQKQCSGNGLQTCNASGQYGGAVACGASTPFCYSGACTATPPSCQGLAATCGASSNESCCTSPSVTGGTFNRSNDVAAPATVSSFRLDKYEVTVGRFRKFVTAVVAGWTPAAGSGKHSHLNGGAGLINSGAGAGNEPGWDTAWNTNLHAAKATWDGTGSLACNATYQTWTASSGGNEMRPINCVNWYQSAAFCIWDAGFLPSEAEWNYAAAGGSNQRTYPWGATAPGANANLAVYGCYFNGSGSCSGFTNIAPVGSVAAGNGLSYGQADLAGNVWEWNLDWYAATYVSPCNNCANVTVASNRVRRGGSFGFNASYLLSSYRDGRTPGNRGTVIGLRCARTP